MLMSMNYFNAIVIYDLLYDSASVMVRQNFLMESNNDFDTLLT